MKKIEYYVLYDNNDYPISYFENYTELTRVLNYSYKNLNYRFKKFGNSIKIVIGNQFYKLFKFSD